MTDEFDFPDFRPRPGRVGSGRNRPITPILLRVSRGVSRGGHGSRSGSSSGGSASVAYGTTRRVVVKARIHKLSRGGAKTAAAHLRYLQRDGAGREGEPGRFYDAGSDDADARAFQDRCDGDRHQFRFIVSPQDGAEMDDLKPFVRKLVADMETDLGTKLEWVAIDHHDTGHPHTHLLVRGRTDRATDLVIDRDYISRGLREAAEERLTRQLGPPSRQARLERIQRDIARNAPTPLDRIIERQADGARRVVPGALHLPASSLVRPAHLTARLRHLKALGLASRDGTVGWMVERDLTQRLAALSDREDKLAKIERAFADNIRTPPATEWTVYDPTLGEPVTGRITALGLERELTGHRYAILETMDGRAAYVSLGLAEQEPSLRSGQVITVTPARIEVSATDRTIDEIARRHGGRYSPILHHRADPKASEAFLRTHVRRLEAERRFGNATRAGDGVWSVPDDYLARVEDGLRASALRKPVTISIEARERLDGLATVRGATWLDRILVGERAPPQRDAGFGRTVSEALDDRRAWLLSQGYAEPDEAGGFQPGKQMLKRLEQDEVRIVGQRLATETGKSYREARFGDRVEGTYKRPVDLASGRYALIEGDRGFSLVPWRDVLERNRGKQVSGVMRGRTVSWTLQRDRGLGR